MNVVVYDTGMLMALVDQERRAHILHKGFVTAAWTQADRPRSRPVTGMADKPENGLRLEASPCRCLRVPR